MQPRYGTVTRQVTAHALREHDIDLVVPVVAPWPLYSRGRYFVNAHGQRTMLVGQDAFMDFRLFLDGGEAALLPLFAEGQALGFNFRRVFFMGAKSQNTIMDLHPHEAGYYDAVRPSVDLANAHGFIVLATIGVDNQVIGMGYDHWSQMADRLRGSATIYSGGNEASKNGFDRAKVPDPQMPWWSRGSGQGNELPAVPATTMEFHPIRQMPTALRDTVASPTEIYDVQHFPEVPLIIDEPPRFGTDGSGVEYLDPDLAWRFARHYATECAAAVFHARAGQTGVLMDAVTRACAEAWVLGMRA